MYKREALDTMMTPSDGTDMAALFDPTVQYTNSITMIVQ